MIPKTLHCIWLSGKPMPEKFQKYVDTWKFVMPDYQINYVTLENLKHSSFVDKALEKEMYTVANHYVRCQEVYDKGGIYLDLDIEVIKKFDDLLSNKFFAGWEDKMSVNNAVFGAVAGHEFLKRCMDEMEKFDFSHKDIELETGPRLVTRNIDATLQLYPSEYFYPYHYTEKYSPNCIKPNTHAVHHWASSWTKPMLSIIVPCYNYAHFLPECIESIRKQTYKNIEIIVVNDGSTDDTIPVCRKLGVRCVTKKNGGLSSARNAGIREAKGEYIMCLDADDILPDDAIAGYMSIVGEKTIAYLGLLEFGAAHGLYSPMGATKESILNNNAIYCSAVYPKKMWEEIGGYDESDTMRLGCEDWEYWIRALWAGYQTKTLAKVGLCYRVHTSSMTRTTTRKNWDVIVVYMKEKHKDKYK